MQAGVVAVLLLDAGLAFAAGLAGQVVEDHSGDPIPSAGVQILNPGRGVPVASTQTGSDGRFETPELPAGDYRIVISKQGYANTVMAFHAGDAARLSIRLVRWGIATGRVMDGGGDPLAGASVAAMGMAGGKWQPVRGLASRVDGNGQFRLDSLPPGEYAVAAVYPSGLLFYPSNRRPQIFTVTGGEEFSNLDFVVLPDAGFRVSGKVELPAPGASFHIALTPVDRPSLSIARTQADEQGAFRFDGVPAGSYDLLASGPGPLYARKRVDVRNQNVAEIALVPQKGRRATVRLRVAGTCPGTATVTLTSREDWGVTLDRTVSVTAGQPAFVDNLPPGAFELAAKPAGENCFQTAAAALDLTSGDAAPAAVSVGEGGSIRGRLTGRNINDFVVMLRAVQTYGDGQTAIEIAEPDTSGGFAFTGLAPGQYRVSPHPAAGRLRSADPGAPMLQLRISSGLATELDLPVPPLEDAK